MRKCNHMTEDGLPTMQSTLYIRSDGHLICTSCGLLILNTKKKGE